MSEKSLCALCGEPINDEPVVVAGGTQRIHRQECRQNANHSWVPARSVGWSHDWEVCRVCGIVRRSDDKNKPCRGRSRIELRGAVDAARTLTQPSQSTGGDGQSSNSSGIE